MKEMLPMASLHRDCCWSAASAQQWWAVWSVRDNQPVRPELALPTADSIQRDDKIPAAEVSSSSAAAVSGRLIG